MSRNLLRVSASPRETSFDPSRAPSAADIKSLRARLGLKQVDLASALGVTQITIARIETGKHKLDRAWEYARMVAALQKLMRKAEKLGGTADERR